MNKQSIAFRLYQLTILLLAPILVIVFLIRSISQKEYRQRMTERFGWLPSRMRTGGIVVHAASVGEVIAVKPFVEQLLIQYPDLPITVTTFTPTGSAQVKRFFLNKVQHCYLPLDISFCVHLFFRLLQPKALVLMETELWPTLIHRCHKSQVKIMLINGRLSAKSLKGYKKLTPLITPALNKFDAILCQSADNAHHFVEMGAEQSIVHNSGNLQYDIHVTEAVESKIAELKQQLPAGRKVVVVGSTHQGEEKHAIEAYKKLKPQHPDLLLVLVPRHPERFDRVADICLQHELNVARRSQSDAVESTDDVWLIDTLGELLATYSFADVCIVAGSFSDIGGHNPLEAALFAKPIIVGTNMANFKDINDKFLDANGIVQLEDNIHLAEKLHVLLTDKELAESIGKNGHDVVRQNQGATQASINKLAALLDQ